MTRTISAATATPRRPRVLATALVAIMALGTAACAGHSYRGIRVSVDTSRTIGTSHLAVGTTHGQHSIESYGNAAADNAATRLLSLVGTYQNQHIYGWGATNPEPTPGHYAWASLDRRIALMRRTGGTPVITLCCAPDWMTALASPTSRYPNKPPTPPHYGDFATLAEAVAKRYPDVTHFVVWNEMKGFWNANANQWDYISYTRMYNKVHDALKSVNPKIQVGGPYLPIEGTGSNRGSWSNKPPISLRNRAVLHYWLTHSSGADFVALDRTITDVHDKATYSVAQKLELTHWPADIARQVRQLTGLPLWIMENRIGGRGGETLPEQAVLFASLLSTEVQSGVDVSLQWGPEPRKPGDPPTEALWSSTLTPGGGKPYPAYYSYRIFHDAFPPGTKLYPVKISSTSVRALASSSSIVLINLVPKRQDIRVGDRAMKIEPYEVLLVRMDGTRLLSTAGR